MKRNVLSKAKTQKTTMTMMMSTNKYVSGKKMYRIESPVAKATKIAKKTNSRG